MLYMWCWEKKGFIYEKWRGRIIYFREISNNVPTVIIRSGKCQYSQNIEVGKGAPWVSIMCELKIIIIKCTGVNESILMN